MTYAFSLVRNLSLAEELTQETFLKIYRVRDSYQPSARFSTWLWTIAHHACMDQLRKGKETHFVDPGEDGPGIRLEDLESPVTDAEAQLLKHSETKRVEHCISCLGSSQREALILRTVSEMSYEEISQVMDVSLSSVKSLIFRAKNALMECLKGLE